MHAQRGTIDQIAKFFLGMRQLFFGLIAVRDIDAGANDMSATIDGQRRAVQVDANPRTVLFPDIGFKLRVSFPKHPRQLFRVEFGIGFPKEILTVHPGNFRRIVAGQLLHFPIPAHRTSLLVK